MAYHCYTMAPSLVTNKKLNGQAREMLSNVIKFFEQEKLNQAPVIPLDQCVKRASVAAGVSMRTIERIRLEAKQNALSDQPWSTPDRKRNVKKSKLGKLNEMELLAVRRIIHECQENEGFHVTLKKIADAIRTELELDISTSSCRRLVRNLGFKWKTTQSNKRILVAAVKSPVKEFETTVVEENLICG